MRSMLRKVVSEASQLAVMVLLSALGLAVHGKAQSSPPPRSSVETTIGTISGKIVNENGEPMAGATLLVRRVDAFTTGRISSTDTEGSFLINNLDPGLYTILPNAPAYTAAPSDPDAPTYYRIGDSVRIEVIRGGVITGTVTNGAGEPVIAVRVRAIMTRDSEGQVPRMASFGLVENLTDDRGIYRIYGLAPGTYVVSAGGSSSQSFQLNPYDSDIPTYAPSSTRDNAVEVTVASGEDSNVDIRYRGEPGYTISGKVKVVSTNGASITLAPAGGSFMPGSGAFQMPGNRGFAFNGIGDGDYDLVAQEVTTGQTSAIPQMAFSEARRVTVKGASVTGIELIPKPLASVSGRVLVEPSKAPECQGKRPLLLTETLVQFRRHEKDIKKDESLMPRIMGTSASPDTTGAFLLRNLLPGRYQFEPRFYARYWYLRSITSKNAPANMAQKPVAAPTMDAAANWMVVKSGEQLTNLTITLAEGAASLRGRLASAEPPGGLSLYLVPAEADKAQDVLRFFVTEITADGTFALSNLPPGRYLVLAHAAGPETATLAKLRLPESATARTKLRRTAETQKSEIDLKPCQNLTDYQIK